MRSSILATRVQKGILGTFFFDKNGDITPSPITILRVKAGGEGMSRATADFADGASVERIITPPAQLVRDE